MTIICPRCGKDLEDKISLSDHWRKECPNPPKSREEMLASLDAASEEINEWQEWQKKAFVYELQKCPKCGEPLKSYMNGWHEFLVCEECEYASDVSR